MNTEPPEKRQTTAQRILNEVQVPSLPEAAVELLTLCSDEFVSASEVVRVVELDPALSARVLKVANSSYFAQRSPVRTLTRAATIMGNENLKVVALGFHLSSGWENLGFPQFDMQTFWRDSVLRACLARRLARTAGFRPAEQAFLVGMLADIGTLIMGTHFGAEYADTLEAFHADPMLRPVAERDQFGTDHIEVAVALARQWRFHEEMIEALARQHRQPPFSQTSDRAALLWQITYFCASVPFSFDGQTARLGEELRKLAMAAFSIGFEALADVFTDCVEQFNALRSVFSHLVSSECDAAALMAEASRIIQGLDADVPHDWVSARGR